MSGMEGLFCSDHMLLSRPRVPRCNLFVAAAEPSAKSVFGRETFIGPQDVRQYLYRMTPKPGEERSAQVCVCVSR